MAGSANGSRWLIVFAAFGGLAVADFLTDAPAIRFAAALAAGAMAVLLAMQARYELRAWGARRWVVSAVWLLLVLCVLAEAERVLAVFDAPSLHVALRLIGWIGLLTAWLAPETTVDVTGGPRPEWAAVRERSMLWLAVHAVPAPERATAAERLAMRVRALDRFRSPATFEYIELYQRLALGVVPPEDAGPGWDRLDELHKELVASFGATPAWASDYASNVRELALPPASPTSDGSDGRTAAIPSDQQDDH